MKSIYSAWLALFFSVITVHAVAIEPTQVTGYVFEKDSKHPLAGVTIGVRDQAMIGATTDNDGRFVLTLPDTGQYTLTAFAPGFDTPPPLDISLNSSDTPPQPVFYLLPTATLAAVEVSAERSPDQISKTVMTGDELRHAPGTMGDPIRALQAMPGVAMGSDASSEPAVRGSGPGDNAYYADSLPIGQLFHFDGTSVFHPSLINDFNLYSAAFSPQYADVTGAILDVSLRNPRTDRFGGKASISLIGASVLLEGPVTSNQSFYFAAKRSYFDLLIGKFSDKGVTIRLPSYYDYQGKYLSHINANHQLSLYMNGAKDSIGFKIAGSSDTAQSQPVLAGESNSNTENLTQALMLDSILSDSIFNKLAVGRTDSIISTNTGTVGTVNADIKTTFLREQLNLQVADKHDVMLGGNYTSEHAVVDIDSLNPTCTQFNPNCDLTSAPRVVLHDNIAFNPWDISARDRWHILPQLTLIGGVRNTHENYLNKVYTEPRLGIEWAWSERTLLTAGWGKHNQIPTNQEILRGLGNPYLSHVRADHRVLGISRTLDEGWTWKSEAYYKKLTDLVVDDPALNYINGGSGKAYGLELLVKKAQTEQLSGWFSLTLAKSERHNDRTGETFKFGYDQPVNTTLVGKYKLASNWAIGSKWAFHTGNPYTPVLGTSGTYPDGRPRPLYGAVNSERLPNYHRLDLRLEHSILHSTWKATTFIEIINAYGNKNVAGYDYGPNYNKKDPIYQLPFLPAFGFEAEF